MNLNDDAILLFVGNLLNLDLSFQRPDLQMLYTPGGGRGEIGIPPVVKSLQGQVFVGTNPVRAG
jgi:hypothetical protein